MTQRNPFTPSFGTVPPVLAGREHIVADIVAGFQNGVGDPNLSTIFTGARGTGKTALLSYLTQSAAEHGWISANVSAVPGMLDDLYERTAEAARHIIEEDGSRLTGITLGSVGVSWQNPEPSPGNWRTRMNAILDRLAKQNTGLLITVDEVDVGLDDMLQLVTTYQHFVREGRLVSLLMAGLPYKVSMLLRNDSVSFLRRAQTQHLGRIDDYEIERAFERTIVDAGRSIGEDALVEATKAIDGFPYMMQLVGFRAWSMNPDAAQISLSDIERGARLARKEVESRILETTYRELSEGDLRFLRAMLPDAHESRVATVAKRMGVASNYASQYKRRLLQSGVIGERGRGLVGFDIPALREFLAEREGPASPSSK